MAFSFCGKRLLLSRSYLTPSYRGNSGFIVLVPEIGEESSTDNPLLKPEDGLPDFNEFTIEKCVAAIGSQAMEYEVAVRDLENDIKTKPKYSKPENLFPNVIDTLEEIGGALDTTWGVAKTLYLGNQSLMPTRSYLTIHDRAGRARASKFNSQIILNAIKEGKEKIWDTLESEERRVIQKYLLEGRLNGLELDKEKMAHLNEIINKLGKERSKFKSKVETATKQFSHTITDPEIIKEFPTDLREQTAVGSGQADKGPWKITLQPHIVSRFLEYCPNRDLRWNVWQADNRKASGYAEKSLENSTQIEAIRALRRDQAKILGYKNFAEMSMETKMGGSVENVRNTLDFLLEHARPKQEEEIRALEEFACSNGFGGNFELYDIPYWKRVQQNNVFKYDHEETRNYFPLPKVLKGLFELAESLFNIKIVERNVKSWHKDVKYFDIWEAEKESPIAGFYVDPYLRSEEKIKVHENSGWMIGIRNQSKIRINSPLAALVFNFAPPVEGKPSLLSFTDVELLFHKFGHSLQHLLTEVKYSEVAGLSNVEWDAVEVSANLLTHFLYENSTLESITSHYLNNTSMPVEMRDNIRKARKHLAGFNLCKQLYLANLDLELHTTNEFWVNVVKRIWSKYFVVPLDKRDTHPCSFTPIFSEEWAAAYYCNIWSKMVAADAYGAFEEVSSKNDHWVIGSRLRQTFLSLGGSCHPSVVFRKFRGRDPSPKALLRTLGLEKTPVSQPDDQSS